MGLGMTLHLGGGELEAPVSLRKAAMSALPLPKGSINTHLFIQQMFLGAGECGSLEHRLEIREIWPNSALTISWLCRNTTLKSHSANSYVPQLSPVTITRGAQVCSWYHQVETLPKS